MIATKSHIEWIDGAKGVAIISVILLYSLPCLHEIGSIFHIGQAVPIFLFVTAYLTSTRFNAINKYFARERIWKLIKNVLAPFLAVLCIQIVCLAIDNRLPSFKSILKLGGVGPGSYYVWLYMLTWVVIVPFIVLMVRRVPMSVSMSIMLLIAIGAEYIFVFLQKIEHIDALYYLLPIRYLMVIYLGCIWSLVDTRQKYILYALACVSGLLIYVDLYVIDNVLIAAVALGATMVEKHFVLDRTIGGPDAAFSMQQDEFATMVQSIRNVEKALGTVAYKTDPSTIKGREFSRSLYVAEDMKTGDVITEENVRSVRPGYGLAPKFLPKLLGKRVNRDLKKGDRMMLEFTQNKN